MLIAADAMRRARAEIDKSSVPGRGKTVRLEAIEKTQRQIRAARKINEEGPK